MSKAAELAALIGSQTALSNRNLIINGAMQVAQRGTSTTDSNGFGVDRFTGNISGMDELVTTYSQSTTAPAGFTTSLKVNIDTAETALAADEFLRIIHKIEAQNLQHLQYGSSGAKSLTLSFWVRGNVTGKYSVFIYSQDGNRSNTQSYTINSADTWEYKTITIDGDTSGTINNDNGEGLAVNFILAAGSDYAGTPHTGWGAYSATDDFSHSDMVQTFATTANNNWQITGIQLEVGEQDTPFEHRSFGDELRRCQRYYQEEILSWRLGVEGTRNTQLPFPHKVSMRAAPTSTLTGGTLTNCAMLGTTNVTADTTNFHFWLGTSGSLQNGVCTNWTFKADAEL